MMGAMNSVASVAPADPAANRQGLRVLGIDIGLQRTGYAVLAAVRAGDAAPSLIEAGLVRIARVGKLERRLLELESGVAALLDQHRPDCVACEELFAHYRHPRTAIRMAHARGVVLVAAARRGLEVLHINATQIKKMLTGAGHAGKAQMQRAVASTLRLAQLPEPSDVADAIAIALAGLRLQDAGTRVRPTRRRAAARVRP